MSDGIGKCVIDGISVWWGNVCGCEVEEECGWVGGRQVGTLK